LPRLVLKTAEQPVDIGEKSKWSALMKKAIKLRHKDPRRFSPLYFAFRYATRPCRASCQRGPEEEKEKLDGRVIGFHGGWASHPIGVG
jgi:hypothetical protein